MRRSARAIPKLLTAAVCLSGFLASAAEPTPDEADEPLKAVLKRESFVLASLPSGLFRASLATRRWERLRTPPEMPMGGVFASEPESSKPVIYVAARWMYNHPPGEGARFGLYLSRDDGATWGLMSERDDYDSALLLPSGALFVITGGMRSNTRSRVLRSPDLGKTWRDISGTGHPFMRLHPDPYHPGLVYAHLSWGYAGPLMVRADDENYQWRVWTSQDPRPASEDFFKRIISVRSGSMVRDYPATLSNYFHYDFGNDPEAPFLEIVPERTRFEFARGESVVVPIRVVFHYDPGAALARWKKFKAQGHEYAKPTTPSEKIAVQPDGNNFWGLRVETPETRVERRPTTPQPAGPGKPESIACQIVELSPSSPYARQIDLARLGDFSKPGEYRVQLLYDSNSCPDRSKGVWDGSFTSPVFTVVVRE